MDNDVTGAGQIRVNCENRMFAFYGWNIQLDITKSQNFWDNVKLSDKTVIIDSNDNVDGTVTKTFGLLTKDSEGYDRFAIYIPEYIDEACSEESLGNFLSNT
jgi:hypothetical protein